MFISENMPRVQIKMSLLVVSLLVLLSISNCYAANNCQNADQLRFVWGDAFTDSDNCLGPNSKPYPMQDVLKMAKKLSTIHGSRMGRSPTILDPQVTRELLLKTRDTLPEFDSINSVRKERSLEQEWVPRNELCRVKYNTTAPKYGISLTSGKAVAIVQKFPDFLQQVVYEKCDCTEHSIIMGECKQTFSPRLMHVIPSGPVTTMGQDYILIESGCRMQLFNKKQDNQCNKLEPSMSEPKNSYIEQQ